MSKKVKIVIPAGTVSVDLPFYCLYIDFATFPSNFWTDIFNNGGDVRAYAEDQTTKLPQAKMNRLSTITKTGGMYVRTPITAATDTVIYITYNNAGLAAIPQDATNGMYECFEGFKAFCHNYGWAGVGLGGAILQNMVDGTAMDIVGTIQDGDGPVDCFNFSGSGGHVRKTLGAETIFTLGVAAIRNPGAGSDMTAAAFGEELRFKLDDVAGAVYNAVDGYTVGDAYSLGQKISLGVTHNGATARALFTDGNKTTDTGVDALSATQFAFGASYDGSNKLRGAIRHAFVYDGILPDAYFEAENAIHGSATITPPIDDGDGEGEKYVIYFAGSSIADVVPTSAGATGNNVGGRFPSTVLENIYCPGSNAGFYIPFTSPLSEFYITFHGYQEISSKGGDAVFWRLYNAALTQTILQVNFNNAATNAEVRAWNGSSFVTLGTFLASGIITQSLVRFDMYFKSHPTNGRVRIKQDGITLFDFTGQTDYGQGDYYSWGSYSMGNFGHNDSAIIIADANTEGSVLYQMAVSGAGALTQWTGAYTDIDEIAYDDVDLIEAAAANLTELVTTTDMGAGPTASIFDALVIGVRGSIGVAAPTQMEGVVRVSGTDYTEAPRLPLTPSLGPGQFIFGLNPATGQPWTGTEINAAEVGVKSIA